MPLDVEADRAALEQLTVAELRARYSELFGEPTYARHKESLARRILWRLQALEDGDLSQRHTSATHEPFAEETLTDLAPQYWAARRRDFQPPSTNAQRFHPNTTLRRMANVGVRQPATDYPAAACRSKQCPVA